MKKFSELYGNLPARLVLASVLNATHGGKTQIPPTLLLGEWGTGKSLLAGIYAAGFNCTKSTNGPCGECASCDLAFKGEHPAVLKISASAEGDGGLSAAGMFLELAVGNLVRVLVVEDVDRLSPVGVLALAKVLDTLPQRAAVVLTSHSTPDPSILTHAVTVRLKNLGAADALEMAKFLTKEAAEEIPAEHVATANGNPRALQQLCTLWNMHPKVDVSKDHSVTMLRAILTGNIQGGMQATYEHIQDGGTYGEAVTGLLRLITDVLEVRATGGTKNPLHAELATLQTEAQALAMLRTLWGQSAVAFVVDPVVRLRTLFSLLCSVAHPQKFVVKAPVTVSENKLPEAPQDTTVTSLDEMQELAASVFGLTEG
jgi:hypothetical protein